VWATDISAASQRPLRPVVPPVVPDTDSHRSPIVETDCRPPSVILAAVYNLHWTAPTQLSVRLEPPDTDSHGRSVLRPVRPPITTPTRDS
jgi:hypothetical protein